MRQGVKITDRFDKITGKVQLQIKNVVTGECRWFDLPNLIVDNFRLEVVHALAGDGGAENYVVDHMGVGTSGAVATVADTGVTGSVTFNVVSVEYISDYSIKFTATLDETQGNGGTFEEVGLFMHNNFMIARRTFAAMAKSSTFAWTFSWTITIGGS